MNKQAEAHLAQAKEYVARGDQFYRKAKLELGAAKESGATVDEMCRYLHMSRRWIYDVLAWNGEGTLYGKDTPDRQERQTKQTLREKPEIVAELTPAEQRVVARKLDQAAAVRQHERKQSAKQKEREHLGDETVDDLELREELQSTEYLLITARGNLRGFVKHLGEIGIDNTPDNWRESCLDWIEDLEGHLGMARALLAGDNIDWSAFDELLAKEGS